MATPFSISLVLSHDSGTTIGDIRSKQFRFLHSDLFAMMPSFNPEDYIGFTIALVSASELMTATAPNGTNRSRIVLLRCSTSNNDPIPTIDAKTHIMMTYDLYTSPSVYTRFLLSDGPRFFCSFAPEYEFIQYLSGGAGRVDAAAYNGAKAYLPAATMHTYSITLIPKVQRT